MYNEGISVIGDLLDVAIVMNVVEKRGTFIMYEGQRIGQGRENAKAYLKDHPDVKDKIEATVRSTMSAGAAAKVAPLTKPEADEDDGESPETEEPGE
jgi:recombination protein RecA